MQGNTAVEMVESVDSVINILRLYCTEHNISAAKLRYMIDVGIAASSVCDMHNMQLVNNHAYIN